MGAEGGGGLVGVARRLVKFTAAGAVTAAYAAAAYRLLKQTEPQLRPVLPGSHVVAGTAVFVAATWAATLL